MAIHILNHTGDFAVTNLIKVGEAGRHRFAGLLVGARIDPEGSYAATVFHEGIHLGAIADPLFQRSWKFRAFHWVTF